VDRRRMLPFPRSYNARQKWLDQAHDQSDDSENTQRSQEGFASQNGWDEFTLPV